MATVRRLSALSLRALAVTAALLATLVTADNAWAIGETSGRLGGVVQIKTGEGKGASKEGVAGVPVTIQSKNLIGGARTLNTADDGSYEFQSLPPGNYTL